MSTNYDMNFFVRKKSYSTMGHRNLKYQSDEIKQWINVRIGYETVSIS